MAYEVLLTNDAAADLRDIYNYINTNDSHESAVYVVRSIKDAVDSLYLTPNRGSIPSELLSLGIKEFREIYFKPYRIIYQVRESSVYILLIADGRRSLQSILERRLFRS